jgi:hypothetical protein
MTVLAARHLAAFDSKRRLVTLQELPEEARSALERLKMPLQPETQVVMPKTPNICLIGIETASLGKSESPAPPAGQGKPG